jgi:hypothetical protein
MENCTLVQNKLQLVHISKRKIILGKEVALRVREEISKWEATL